MMIGDVEIPIVTGIIEMDQTTVDEIKNNDVDNVVVQHEPDMTMLTISGFLNKEVHSSQNSLDGQRKEFKQLRETEFESNTFDYNVYDGLLMIESAQVIENSLDSAILEEVEIEAWYFPYPKYR
jgi:hypothetical protein